LPFPNRLLTFDELRDHGVPLGRKQIARLERAGKFPKRVQISDARFGWPEREVYAYVRARIDARA
jgi:prophage regulatory protein